MFFVVVVVVFFFFFRSSNSPLRAPPCEDCSLVKLFPNEQSSQVGFLAVDLLDQKSKFPLSPEGGSRGTNE